jgi:hypothetical protein
MELGWEENLNKNSFALFGLRHLGFIEWDDESLHFRRQLSQIDRYKIKLHFDRSKFSYSF